MFAFESLLLGLFFHVLFFFCNVVDLIRMCSQYFERVTYPMNSLNIRCINLAALSCRFQILVEDTISNSFLVGNCFLNFTSICSCNFLKSSDSSTCPSTCLTRACRMSRQWILLPFAMGRLKLTNATTLGFDIPRGGSRLAMKSLSCENRMNCVACGSYLDKELKNKILTRHSDD